MAMASSPQRSSPLAILFTDSRGRIVFVDNNFLKLLHLAEATGLVGSPLHKVVGIDAPSVNSLMQDVARSGYVHDRPLDLHKASGETHRVLVSSVAAYNPEGEFIGADLTFHDVADAIVEHEVAPVHADVLQSRIQQMQEEVKAEPTIREEQVLPQLYFTAQINALQVLIARMGGPRIQSTFESLLNKAAAKHGWPVKLLDSQLTVGENTPLAAYAELLKTVTDYGINIIGSVAVLEEMRSVDSHMGARTQELADQVGLRTLLA